MATTSQGQGYPIDRFGGRPVVPISTPVSAAGLLASASGLAICVGEIFGGRIAPIIVGGVAEHFGQQYMLYLAIGGLALGFVNSWFLQETAPNCLPRPRVEARAEFT